MGEKTRGLARASCSTKEHIREIVRALRAVRRARREAWREKCNHLTMITFLAFLAFLVFLALSIARDNHAERCISGLVSRSRARHRLAVAMVRADRVKKVLDRLI